MDSDPQDQATEGYTDALYSQGRSEASTAMIGKYVLNQHKEPVLLDDLQLWASFFEEDEKRIVKQEYVTVLGELCSPFKHPWVSTVFLGLDHNFMGKGPPIVFESMVFGGPFNHEMWRYATWDEAVTGHERLVECVKDPTMYFGKLKHNIADSWTDWKDQPWVQNLRQTNWRRWK